MRPTAPTWRYLAIILCIALSLAACRRDYTSRMTSVLDAIDNGDYQLALTSITELIERGAAGKNPEAKNLTLLLLERASIYQALGDYERAVQDFNDADQMLELLDLTPQGARDAARFLFNDSATVYHSPIYEKLMVNVSALASYLSLGNIQAANVEARRIIVLGEYFEGAGYETHPALATAYTLAGIAAEFGGQTDTARRFYQDSLEIADTDIARQSLAQLQGEIEAPAQEAVVIILAGTGPIKRPERFPLGVALGWVNDSFPLGDNETEIVGGLSAEELATWVNYPVLERRDPLFTDFEARAAATSTTIPLMSDVAAFAEAQWEQMRPAIAGAAISRALTRIVARTALQESGQAAGGIGGALLRIGGLATQASMQAADIPDTRAWNTMPGQIYVARLPVSTGSGQITITGTGPGGVIQQSFDTQVEENGATFIVSRVLGGIGDRGGIYGAVQDAVETY